MKVKQTARFLLWFLFFVTFTTECVKILFEFGPSGGHKPPESTYAFFWTCLLLIELVMAGLIVYAVIRYPARRARLLCLAAAHFTVILVLPMLLGDWSWTCLLYPWPHSLQCFDPATPRAALVISLAVGLVAVPLMTYRWGIRAFCGYLCPHGAFFSETYGRLFPGKPVRSGKATRIIPPLYFALMTAALAFILFRPDYTDPIRTAQKLSYFFTAEFFYFVIGIPLLGGRSYCMLVCPMGYFIKMLPKRKAHSS